MGDYDRVQGMDNFFVDVTGMEPGVENSLCFESHCLSSVTSSTRMFVDVSVNGVPARALFDTGATLSCVSTDFLSRWDGSNSLNTVFCDPVVIKVADNRTYRSLSNVEDARLKVGGKSMRINLRTMPLPNKIDVLLGTDFMNEHQARIEFAGNGTAKVSLGDHEVMEVMATLDQNGDMVEGSTVFYVGTDLVLDMVSPEQWTRVFEATQGS